MSCPKVFGEWLSPRFVFVPGFFGETIEIVDCAKEVEANLTFRRILTSAFRTYPIAISFALPGCEVHLVIATF